jgi:hypothetical protein
MSGNWPLQAQMYASMRRTHGNRLLSTCGVYQVRAPCAWANDTFFVLSAHCLNKSGQASIPLMEVPGQTARKHASPWWEDKRLLDNSNGDLQRDRLGNDHMIIVDLCLHLGAESGIHDSRLRRRKQSKEKSRKGGSHTLKVTLTFP